MHFMEIVERDWVIHGFMLLPKGMDGSWESGMW